MLKIRHFNILTLTHFVVNIVYAKMDKCTELIESQSLKNNYCDGYLISSLTRELKQLKSTNKYLQEKFLEYSTDIEKTCQSTESVKICSKPDIFIDCMAAINYGTGPYVISSPLPEGKPFMLYCKADNNLNSEPWIVIQRRVNDEIDFEESWENYVRGFGDIFNSFWLGLQRIHEITYSKLYELRITLKDFENNTRQAFYDNFAIGDEKTGFSLFVLGKYSGDAGDSLRSQSGFPFSTIDKHNLPGTDWAKKYNGAWWFSPTGGRSHLNGEYFETQGNKDYEGIVWSGWRGTNYSLSFTEMAIRKKFYKYCN